MESGRHEFAPGGFGRGTLVSYRSILVRSPLVPPARLIVMGVAGAGKSLIGEALARALDVDFVEGDTFHSAENVARMAAGVPLTDELRAGWLQRLADRLAAAHRDGSGIVITCSALKRAYRDLLRAGAPDVRFVFLTGGRDLLAQRLAARRGHFMPPSLLDSQLATLEEPAPDEAPLTFDIAESPRDIVAALLARLREDQ